MFNSATLSPIDLAHHEYWRLITSGFLHLSPMHIAVNMFSLYILGTMLEPILGTGRFLQIHLTSLFGGSAAVALFAGENTATAGASGAIYGLMGAMLVIVLKLKAPAGQVIAVIAINLVISISVPGISSWGTWVGCCSARSRPSPSCTSRSWWWAMRRRRWRCERGRTRLPGRRCWPCFVAIVVGVLSPYLR